MSRPETHERSRRPGLYLTLRRTLVLTLAVTVAATLAGCGQSASSPRQATEANAYSNSGAEAEGRTTTGADSTQTVTVTRAVDGDTVVIQPSVLGREDLRLIGVDTPELSDSQPLAQKAADFTADKLEGQRVRLTLGRDPVGPYDRLLGVVKPEGQQLTHGAVLLQRGYAQTLFYEPNIGYRPLYNRLQEDARQSRAGIWGLPLESSCELADDGNDIGAWSPECEG